MNNSSSNSSSNAEQYDVSSEVFPSLRKVQGLNEVLVLPVLKRVSKSPGRSISGNELGVADDELSELLVRSVELHTSLQVLNSENSDLDSFVDRYKISLSSSGLTQESLFKIAESAMDKTGAESVLFAIVDMSDERTGGKIGSERSSELKYRMWLIESSQRSVIWSSAYRSKETTLSENLFSINKKVRNGLSFSTYSDLITVAFRGSAKRLESVLPGKRR